MKTLIPLRRALYALVLLLVVALEPPMPATATPPMVLTTQSSSTKALARRARPQAQRPGTPPFVRSTPAPEGTPLVHEVIPAETLEEVAARYGTTAAIIARRNGLSDENAPLAPGEHLLVQAHKVPEPRRLRGHLVRSGEGWHSLAARYATTVQKLRAWNAGLAPGLRPGQALRIWVDGDLPAINPLGLGLDIDTSGLMLKAIPARSYSAGTPNRGRLLNGAQLPINTDLYWRRRPEFAYGSSHMLKYLQLAVAKFRQRSQYPHELILSDMSQRRGGAFGHHESHRSGRDVDIWLPRTDEVAVGKAVANTQQVNWDATWQLVKALVRTGQVQYIFLSRSRQRFLYRAAKADGLNREQLRALMQFPRHSGQAVIRHEPGHRKHLHVRFLCGPQESRCR